MKRGMHWSSITNALRAGQLADQPIPEEIREHLPLVDLRSRCTRLYSDNLKQCFDRASRESNVEFRCELGSGKLLKYDRDNPSRRIMRRAGSSKSAARPGKRTIASSSSIPWCTI